MDTLVWYKVKWQTNEQNSMTRFPDLFNFSSCIVEHDNRILIFGGMGASYSQSKNLYCI